jgi:hypothetical protein
MPSDRGTFGGILGSVDVFKFFDNFDCDREALFDRDDTDKAGATDGLQSALDSLVTHRGVFSPRFQDG